MRVKSDSNLRINAQDKDYFIYLYFRWIFSRYFTLFWWLTLYGRLLVGDFVWPTFAGRLLVRTPPILTCNKNRNSNRPKHN
jgi:hypothetical protein